VNGSVPLDAVVPRTPVDGVLGVDEDVDGEVPLLVEAFGDEECVAPRTPVAGAAGVTEVDGELLLVEALLVDELLVVELLVVELFVVELLTVLLFVVVLFTVELFVVELLVVELLVLEDVDSCVPQLELLAGMLESVGHGWQLALFAAIEWSYEHGVEGVSVFVVAGADWQSVVL